MIYYDIFIPKLANYQNITVFDIQSGHFLRSSRLEFYHNTYLVLITDLAQDIIKGSLDLRKLLS